MTWKTDQIQAVMFPLPGAKQSSALELWRNLFPSVEPESFQSSGPSPVGGSQASGASGKFQITLSSQIGRIDIALSIGPEIDNPMAPPQIEDLSEALGHIDRLVRATIEKIRIARVATVVQFSAHLSSPSEVVRYFKENVGLSFPNGSTDNLYQFNVRKQYESAPGIYMNRVMTWSAGAKQLVNAQFDMTSTSFGVSNTITIPLAALKIDVNSSTSQDISERAAAMFSEHSKEIQSLVSGGLEAFRER